MLWFKCYPSLLPLYAVCHALFWLPMMYLVAISYDHVQPFIPFVSSFGIYSPEKYMVMSCLGSYGIMTIISQWFWCSMIKGKIKRKSYSIVGQYTCIFIALLYTIAGICIVLLSFFNMKDNNKLHFHLTLTNFICHVVAIPLSSLLIVHVFRRWKHFLLARIMVTLQMILGSCFFIYFNRAGLLVLKSEDLYYIKDYEPGYKEFNQCAASEWLIILGLIEITLVTGLELRTNENHYVMTKVCLL
ncbi:prokaryotic DNA topoisomerase [Schistosoma japonicum]|nr:prokaryotic DNA topoisomerase [Schistosoma japonicum]KAH8850866.1 prokaryotic DNA topoisomerase [Schistosoma japonicum]